MQLTRLENADQLKENSRNIRVGKEIEPKGARKSA